MTVPELLAFLKGFSAFHGAPDDDVTDDEYLAVLAEELAAGHA